MAVRVTIPSPRRILATGFGAFLVLYVLTAAWVVVEYDTESAATEPAPRAVASPAAVAPTTVAPPSAAVEMAVDITGETITVTGVVASLEDARAVARLVRERTSAPLVVNRLEVDPDAAGPLDTATLLATLDERLGGS